MHLAKLALKLGTKRGGCHQVDGYGVPVIFLGGVKDLAVFLPGFSRICWGMMKQWGINCYSQWEMWMTQLFCSSLFMVDMTWLILALIEG